MSKLNIVEYWDGLTEIMSAEIDFINHSQIVHMFFYWWKAKFPELFYRYIEEKHDSPKPDYEDTMQ
jgi:hypothetical protein